MIIAFVLSIIACAIPSTILLIQIVGGIARNLANRHFHKYHNFDTIWWHVEHALDSFML